MRWPFYFRCFIASMALGAAYQQPQTGRQKNQFQRRLEIHQE